ncbi:helix-turn-helix transcriptional regulator [Haloechinothrix sp. YIM 98757]|uniref:Helix-turn-helix transcriptional regulator n=1 Tax=Haloechinothrix aidingensis TaxID=2752311 RepID=A0A838A7G6_9PSEU|nr:helix-turn-helix transcriptional regulator [Haloechinothrix aidingensis]MBA0124072.1 helix-turn-helix transcriptional regulator [Haloechinothrix aidingensis]
MAVGEAHGGLPVPSGAGEAIRAWRARRRVSQLDLALRTGVSTKHISFIETGRSTPTRDMITRLAEQLDIPLRDRNKLLLLNGYAPAYPERDLDDPELESVRGALHQVLRGHEPYPAALVDRVWNLVDANESLALFTVDVSAELLEGPVNVLRLSLHPDGMAPRIDNLPEWRAHVLDRLRRQIDATDDPELRDLHSELRTYPCVTSGHDMSAMDRRSIAVPLRYRSERGRLTFVSTTAVFGTPLDVTVSELAVEAFFPADAATMRALAGGVTGAGEPAFGDPV